MIDVLIPSRLVSSQNTVSQLVYIKTTSYTALTTLGTSKKFSDSGNVTVLYPTQLQISAFILMVQQSMLLNIYICIIDDTYFQYWRTHIASCALQNMLPALLLHAGTLFLVPFYRSFFFLPLRDLFRYDVLVEWRFCHDVTTLMDKLMDHHNFFWRILSATMSWHYS
jgi:hypothetical protein